MLGERSIGGGAVALVIICAWCAVSGGGGVLHVPIKCRKTEAKGGAQECLFLRTRTRLSRHVSGTKVSQGDGVATSVVVGLPATHRPRIAPAQMKDYAGLAEVASLRFPKACLQKDAALGRQVAGHCTGTSFVAVSGGCRAVSFITLRSVCLLGGRWVAYSQQSKAEDEVEVEHFYLRRLEHMRDGQRG